MTKGSGKLFTANGLADATGLDRRSVAARLADMRPDGNLHGRDAWTLQSFWRASAQYEPANTNRSTRDDDLLAAMMERLNASGQVSELKVPISEAAAFFGVAPDTAMTWLRAGCPRVLDDRPITTETSIVPSWVIHWIIGTVARACTPADFARLRTLGLSNFVDERDAA